MHGRSRRRRSLFAVFSLAAACFFTAAELPGQVQQGQKYKILAPILQGKLTVFPVVGDETVNTDNLISLDRGVQSGEVSMSEGGRPGGFARPRHSEQTEWSERPQGGPETNRAALHLVITNHSNRVLLLLAGEIVMVGKQNRVIAEDRLIPAHSKPVTVDYFRVRLPALTPLGAPVQQPYEQFFGPLRFERPLGVVVAVDRQLIWADVFASPSLLAKYWPELMRFYAGESVGPSIRPAVTLPPVTEQQAQKFLERTTADKERIATEPGIYRYTEFENDRFKSFLLTGLFSNLNFDIHLAKMRRWSFE